MLSSVLDEHSLFSSCKSQHDGHLLYRLVTCGSQKSWNIQYEHWNNMIIGILLNSLRSTPFSIGFVVLAAITYTDLPLGRFLRAKELFTFSAETLYGEVSRLEL